MTDIHILDLCCNTTYYLSRSLRRSKISHLMSAFQTISLRRVLSATGSHRSVVDAIAENIFIRLTGVKNSVFHVKISTTTISCHTGISGCQSLLKSVPWCVVAGLQLEDNTISFVLIKLTLKNNKTVREIKLQYEG